MTAETMIAMNDFITANAVKPGPFKDFKQVDGGNMTVVLPAKSVVVIRTHK